MNPANAVTVSRIVLVVPFVLCMYLASEGAPETQNWARWAAAGIFGAASLTDYLDGYLARRLSRGSETGEWLDPLADKILVGAALVTLVAFRQFPLWAGLVIAVREVVVASLRSAAVKRGHSMPAARAAKLKTAVQLPMVFVWLLDRGPTTAALQDGIMLLAVALTLFSGAQYLSRSRQLLARKA